jgi:hypothetical protein
MNGTGVGAWQTSTIPLADGEAGTAQTIRLIRGLIEHGVKHPLIRRTATNILQGIPPYNDAGEVSAIFHWVLQNIRFTKDMVGVGHGIETLQPAASILETKAGDCDDINAILLPSLLGSVGYETRAVTIKSNPEDPENFSHIYIEVNVNGQWIALDAARPDAAFGRAPEVYWSIHRWPLTGGGEMLGRHNPRGPIRRRTFPRFGMGDFDWTAFAQTALKSAPAIEQGAAQIVSAANMPQYSPYGLTSQYAVAPALTATASGSSSLLLIIGIGALALIFMSRGRG